MAADEIPNADRAVIGTGGQFLVRRTETECAMTHKAQTHTPRGKFYYLTIHLYVEREGKTTEKVKIKNRKGTLE